MEGAVTIVKWKVYNNCIYSVINSRRKLMTNVNRAGTLYTYAHTGEEAIISV